MPEGECFANTAAMEREHSHLVYTEGFAVASAAPVGVAHGWCTDSERPGGRSDPVGPGAASGSCTPFAVPQIVTGREARLGEWWILQLEHDAETSLHRAELCRP
ncbi:hypothetical protein ABTY00_36820 [Streptomyces microflavus]|uniref:hypothetical protein n=1 Tax=Streptomyces microflavus TaxID=1919 RepID=UPI003316B43C